MFVYVFIIGGGYSQNSLFLLFYFLVHKTLVHNHTVQATAAWLCRYGTVLSGIIRSQHDMFRLFVAVSGAVCEKGPVS